MQGGYQLLRRFWSKVDFSGECWLWRGTITAEGYGQFAVTHDKRAYAHRFAYELVNGAIPEGLTIDHLCRARSCVNPSHMEPVTRAENTLRGESPSAENHRKTECARGHAYAAGNTYVDPRGYRHCRVCLRARTREYKARKRAA
jgi:hypothetical protein